MDHLSKVLELTAGMAEELLRCGAEISRAEETVVRIARHYGTTKQQIYIISNGAFVNLEYGKEARKVSLANIPQGSVDLGRLCDLNSLSREIERDNLDVDTALMRFEKIKAEKKKYPWDKVLASGIGAAAFCALFQGALSDCLAAFGTGVFIWAFFVAMERFHISKVLLHIAGTLIIASACVLLAHLGLVENLDKAIIGAIIPMIPGVAFINGVRDLVDSNYLSGAIRLLDAVLIFICMATGVYLALHLGGEVIV